jgi:hypothetical protein
METRAAKRQRAELGAEESKLAHTTATTGFARLPAPVVALCISFLSLGDHVRAAQACKLLLAVCKSPFSWATRIELSRSPGTLRWAVEWNCAPFAVVAPNTYDVQALKTLCTRATSLDLSRLRDGVSGAQVR